MPQGFEKGAPSADIVARRFRDEILPLPSSPPSDPQSRASQAFPVEPAGPFDLGGVRVEPGLNTLTGPQGAVTLEPKVMEVLQVLARRHGETVAAEELIAEVWEGREVVDAVVTRAISELRRALGDDPKNPRFIQTVARRGYRLIAPLGPPETAPPAPSPASPSAKEGPWISLPWLLAPLALALLLTVVWLVWRGVRPKSPEEDLPPEAYRLYAQAKQALAGGSCVAQEVLGDLKRVLELAPTFAPGWEAYGWAQYNRVSSCGESGAAYAEAMSAAQRAAELAPERSGALAIQAAVLTETGRAELAYELLAPRLAAGPPDVEVLVLAGYALTYAGALEAAATLAEQVMARDPTFYQREGWTPNALLYLGRERRFLEISAQGGSPLARFYRGYAWYRLGDGPRALAELAPIFADRPSDPFARQAEAVVAILEKRPDDARLLIGQLALQRARLDSGDGELSFRLAELSAAAGDPHRALALVTQAVEQGFFCTRCFAGSASLRPLAAEAAFLAALEQARERESRFPFNESSRP